MSCGEVDLRAKVKPVSLFIHPLPLLICQPYLHSTPQVGDGLVLVRQVGVIITGNVIQVTSHLRFEE